MTEYSEAERRTAEQFDVTVEYVHAISEAYMQNIHDVLLERRGKK